MTASSVEFFPCRVQPMGLPRSASATTLEPQPPPPPPIAKVRGASRNLFGSVESGEISSLLQQETIRHAKYVAQRYSIDINLFTNSGQQPTNSAPLPSSELPTRLPTLIAQELKQHEQRLQKEQYNLNRAAVASEITPPNAKIHQPACGGVNKITRRCCGDNGLTPPSSLERQKPYPRQLKITERFNIRKNMPASSSLSSSSLSLQSEMLSLRHRVLDTHRNVQVLNLPQAMQAEKMGDINEEVNNTHEKTKDVGDASDDDNSYSSQTQQSNNNNSTMLSVKFVVSTQNGASRTLSSSSASREHKDHA